MRALFYLLTPLLVIFQFWSPSVIAQAPKFSNEFLHIGVGARSHGMAGAQTASVYDATAAYWNPAGLAGLNSVFQINAMHAEWFAGIGKYDYLAVAKPIKSGQFKSVLGFTLIRFGVDNIPNTFHLVSPDGSVNFDNLTTFSAADYAFLASYGREFLIPGLKIGANVKVIHRRAGDFATAWGFGLDLGMQYHINNRWLFGLTARDVTSTFNAWNYNFTPEEKVILNLTNNEIPDNSLEITLPEFSFGLGYQAFFGNHLRFLGEINLDMTTDGQRNVLISSKAINIDPSIGMEATYRDFISLRGGLGNFQKTTDNLTGTKTVYTFQPNIGVGVRIGQIQIDYALTDIGNVSQVLYSHIFSISLNLKPEPRPVPTPRPFRPGNPARIIEQID